jgi:glycine betaine/proline transport system substrate-binding protein
MIDKLLQCRRELAGMFAIALASGCTPSPGGPVATSAVPTSADGVKLAYVDWSSCIAATHVVKAVLEQQGFRVETVSLTGAAMYPALARGTADATVCAWLPSTHAAYYAGVRNQVINLGPNMAGTRIGLVVPDYVSIDSIDQLAAHADRFGHHIIGIDPDAGEMGIAREAIETYRLPLELVEGTDTSMAAALGRAIGARQWIVVTGWTPHWMWARWKLKYLADPKGSFGGTEDIDTLVRKGLRRDRPRAYAVLDGFRWTSAQMQQVMAAGRQPGSDVDEKARAWVKAHPELVSGWISGGVDTRTGAK